MAICDDATALSSISGGCKGENIDICVGSSNSLSQLHLFGRSTESAELLAAFQAVSSDHTSRIVAVHGNSGMGKTSLVEWLRDQVVLCEHQAYFCSGKFFQNSSNDAYCAVMAAFSDLCDLVTQADDFDQRREGIRSALGAEGCILSHLISSISQFLPSEEDGIAKYDTVLDKTALTRFKVACKSFLRAMSDERHPIVLFIDDLQWADESSKQLLETLLTDCELRDVLFVLAYRDEEAESAEKLLSSTEAFVDIKLERLSDIDVQDMLVHQMRKSADDADFDVKELGKLAALKTQGNPFHLHQYLEFIQAERLLTYHPESNSWKFDVTQIQNQTMVPDSLVEILERRLNRLPPNILQTLTIAALLGYIFEERVLTDVVSRLHKPKEESHELGVKEILSYVIEEGLVEESTSKGRFLFSHDKLLSSFRTRIRDYKDLPRVHFEIAETFVNLKNEDKQYACQAAQHANAAKTLFEQCYGMVALIELNLEAAAYCTKRNVFAAAVAYLRKAVELLDRDGNMWEQSYDLGLNTVEDLTAVELVLGNFPACTALISAMLLHSTSQETTARALQFEISVKVAENQIVGSNKTAKNGLKNLGVHFPAKVSALLIGRKLFRVRRLLRSRNDLDASNLPILNDARKLAIHGFLIHIAVMALTADKERHLIYPALLVVENSLKEGFSTHSAIALAICAMAEITLGEHKRAARYGQLAFAVARKCGCLKTECKISSLLYIIVLHWKQPLQGITSPLSNAFTGCFAAGEHWYAALAASNFLLSSLASGANLVDLAGRARYFLGRFQEFNQKRLATWIMPLFQCILNLTTPRDNWNDATSLTGAIMDEKAFLEVCSRKNYATMTNTVLNLKLLLAYHFGYYDLAESLLIELTSTAKVMRLHYMFYMYHFFAGMTYFALSKTRKKRKYVRLAVRHRRKLQNLRSIECPNWEPLVKVLLAEEMSLAHHHCNFVSKYELAIETAAQACTEAGLVQHKALVYERAGFVFSRNDNDSSHAEHYFDRAVALYGAGAWGARAKRDWLKEQYKAVLPDSQHNRNNFCCSSILVPIINVSSGSDDPK